MSHRLRDNDPSLVETARRRRDDGDDFSRADAALREAAALFSRPSSSDLEISDDLILGDSSKRTEKERECIKFTRKHQVSRCRELFP